MVCVAKALVLATPFSIPARVRMAASLSRTIEELSTFVQHGQSYQAEEGHTDDLAMCSVLFAWMTNQQYFKELTDIDLREKMFLEHQNQLEQDMAPFGFFTDGLEDENIGQMVDEYGTRWSPIVRNYDTNW